MSLSARIALGDMGAIEALHDAWFDRAVRLARRASGRDVAFGEDAAQAALIRAVRYVRPMPTDADLDRWMVSVVLSCTRDALRADARRAAREARSDRAHVNRTSHDDLAWLREAIASLDPRDQALIVARFGDGGSLTRAAAVEMLTIGAAHGRIRRAVAKLRALFEEPRDA